MSILKILVDICLFQAKPQDLPASQSLVLATGAGTVITNLLVHRAQGEILQVLVNSVAQVVVFGLCVWMVLRLKLRVERFPQTISAIYGSSALLQLVAWPMAASLPRTDNVPELSLPILLILGVGIWVLAISVHVLREALEVSVGAGILYTLGCQVFTGMLVFAVLGKVI